VIPVERRGKAMGAVMGAFSVASVVGVPAGLELARQGGWRMPFFAVAALGLLVTGGAIFWLPPLRGHLGAHASAPPLGRLLGRKVVLLSYAMTAVTMAAGFILIPNISAYVQHNLGYPRSTLGRLYLVGGGVSFVTMRGVGWLVDRLGSFRVGTLGSAMLVGIVYGGFYRFPPAFPVIAIFAGFMFAMSFRNIAYNTLTTKVPEPDERARFMSIQSAVQHFASATGAFISAHMLVEQPGGQLVGIPRVAAVSMALTALLPLFLAMVERRVVARPPVRLHPIEPQSGIGVPVPLEKA
jgi:predicted MFS family arabinose efflux permease